jgi:hypothetical protein
MRPGRYAFSYVRRSDPYSPSEGRALPLGVVDVQGELTGLVLEPIGPTGFAGVLRIEGGKPPEELRIYASSKDGWSSRGAPVKAPDYRFELTDLHPGTYDLRVASERRSRAFVNAREEFYVRGIRNGSEITPARNLEVTEGGVRQIELVISDEFANVTGIVRARDGSGAGTTVQQGAQFHVGLSGPSGLKTVQADQNGQFSFGQIVPGEYKICAWPAHEAQAAYDDRAWEKAGDAVREFSVEPGSEVEISLTAVP